VLGDGAAHVLGSDRAEGEGPTQRLAQQVALGREEPAHGVQQGAGERAEGEHQLEEAGPGELVGVLLQPADDLPRVVGA
jgi:hypothetical protein